MILCSAATRICDADEVSQREFPTDHYRISILPASAHVEYSPAGSPHFDFLSDLQNRVLYLALVEGLSYRQIALEVHRSVETVRSILFRARRIIRNAHEFT